MTARGSREQYRVVVVGLGRRGVHHIQAFCASERFAVVGIADLDSDRLAAAGLLVPEACRDADAARVMSHALPDLLCFCTPPAVRLPLVELGVRHGVRLIAFEKPVATTSAEALAIKRLLAAHNVRGVVCHQHRYGPHYKKVKEVIESGALGQIHTIVATGVGWMLHIMPHLIEYTRWFNDYADAAWVMAQAAGRSKAADDHPSPDYLAGVIHFGNGVRAVVETGAGAPDVPEVAYWWRKNRICAIGPRGFAEVLTGAGWRVVSDRGAWSGSESMSYENDMPPYVDDMAAWLDDDSRTHPCGFDRAFASHEIMMALCRSATCGTQVALPLAAETDERVLLREGRLSEIALPSSEENRLRYRAAAAGTE